MNEKELLKNLSRFCDGLFDEVVEFQTGEMAAFFIAGVSYGLKTAQDLGE